MNSEKYKKNALIVTLPIGKNYGGIIQAFAMTKAVNKCGVSATVGVPYSGYKGWMLGATKDFVYKSMGRKREGRPSPGIDVELMKHTKQFIDKNIPTVRLFDYSRSKNAVIAKEYKYFVSGSDQVWRGWRALPFYMSDFAINNNSGSVRISYAASFGVADPGFTKYVVDSAKPLIDSMEGVSVRESDGVDVCSKYWGVRAEQHVDPTLLLAKEDYIEVIDDSGASIPDRGLFAYVLDRAGDKGRIIDMISKHNKLSSFEILPKAYTGRGSYVKDKNSYVLPPVEQWLRSFRDAKYIVTDSFHGTVFSIIFNKPFIAISNKERGLARFTSLLKMFDLEDRLVTSADEVTEELINQSIDWDLVNAKIKAEQKRSFDYLKKHLG